MKIKLAAIVVIFSLVSACGKGRKPDTTPETQSHTTANQAAAKAYEANPNDDPRISRSRGEKGGVVVLYPRIFPATSDSTMETIAQSIHFRLRKMVETALPGRPVDMRPAPERECPKAGCLAVSVGAVLAHKDGGCVVGVLLGAPDTAPRTLVPWAGGFTVKAPSIPFREPAESYIEIADFANCADMNTALDAFEPNVIDALQKLAIANP
ncbi:MAG: hypothetical protein HUU55_20725 [Myxococcales bacterium]|nr:hypothetical protein [Myxococcales bacterium]